MILLFLVIFVEDARHKRDIGKLAASRIVEEVCGIAEHVGK